MKPITLIWIALSFIFFSCEREAPSPQSQGNYEKLAAAHTHFAFDLLEELEAVQPDENIFFSPLSISMALSMTNNGAAGESYREISHMLYTDDMTVDEINEGYQSMHYDLENLDPRVQLKIANSTWANTGFPVKEDFKTVVKKYYDAEAYTKDFANTKTVDEINGWAADQTGNKIRKILDQIDPATRMVLLNAIYFKGDWKYEFDKSLTKEADFYVSPSQAERCQMMHVEGDFDYFSDDKVEIVDLPYGNEAFTMSIILPKDSYSLDQLIGDIDADQWQDWMTKMNDQSLIVEMPSIELRYERFLNDELKALGMREPFLPGLADLSKLTSENVFISFVKHDSFLKIDEKGTEAAAVTTVAVELSSAGGRQSPLMRVDRPYLLLIREKSTDNLLFVGKIKSPTL